jgi:hypothetical protein
MSGVWVRIVKVYADYRRKCENCDQSPVVSLTGLCGPCTFGEAACIDPSEWEGDYRFTGTESQLARLSRAQRVQ